MPRLRFLLLLLLLSGGCQHEPDTPWVARVGGEYITADEFRLSYEFGYGHLRRSDDPRQAYLQHLIDEQVLALEARKLRLDTSAAVVHAMRTLREELLIERVFDEHVLRHVTVTDEEIRQEVNKAAVSFRFRFLPAPTEAAARTVQAHLAARGYDAVLDEQQASLTELGFVPADFTSPYVKAEDVDPLVLEAIRDLPLHTPSAPVAYDGQWLVFEVMDIRRERLADVNYAAKAPTIRKQVYNRKALEQATAFVAGTMAPLQVTTRREGFEVLCAALWPWYRAQPPTRNLLPEVEARASGPPHLDLLRQHLHTPLVQFGTTRWAIRDFLAHFTPGRYPLRPDDEAAFKAQLADVVALVVRDYIFLEQARHEHLGEDAHHQRLLRRWEDKWLFQTFRQQLAPEAVRAQQYARIWADSVRARYRVEINHDVLDTLTLHTSDANPLMTVLLYKSNSNKMPFPIADPLWGEAVHP
jgi:hypothetical protein